jgi:HEPN domain-containing protein
MPSPLEGHAQAWLAFAHEDLAMAEDLLESPNVVRRGICFHAQQAVEKALKAFFVLDGKKPPHTHNLEKLCASLPGGHSVPVAPKELRALTRWATEFRYPGPWPEASEQEAREAVTLARNVVDAVDAVLSKK